MITITSSPNSNTDVPAVLEVAGRLDSHASVALLNSVQQLLKSEIHEIIMDFDKLEAVSSEGLAALVQTKSRLRKVDGDLRLANVHGPTLEVLRIVHFDRLFGLHLNVEDAVQQFAVDRRKANEWPDRARPDGERNDG